MRLLLALLSVFLLNWNLLGEDYFGPRLSLDQERIISNEQGILLPNEIIKLKAGDIIKLYFSNGTFFTATVKTSQFQTPDKFECYGESITHENTGFGFVLTKDGVFAGAVVMRNSDTTYKIGYSPQLNGFILFKDVNPKIQI